MRPAPEAARRDAWLALGALATTGPGVPYAIGAKFAHGDRPTIALVGDGAMHMNGMAELITIAKYWRDWADPRLIVAVFNNRDLNQVTWEMRAMEGVPQFLPPSRSPTSGTPTSPARSADVTRCGGACAWAFERLLFDGTVDADDGALGVGRPLSRRGVIPADREHGR